MRIVRNSDDERDLLTQFVEARQARDRAQIRLDELQERLTKEMEANQQKSMKYAHNGLAGQVTYVQNTITKIDEAGLRKALTAKVYDKYTKRSLDKKKMEEAMDQGVIDPMIVVKYVSTAPSKPFLRISAHEERDEA